MLQANFTPSRIGTITSLKTTISYFVALFVVFAAAANGVCSAQDGGQGEQQRRSSAEYV